MKRARSPEQKQRVREAIISVGRRVFADAGLSDVSLRRVAADAGCSPGLVYQYFKDKRDLLLAIGETDQATFADALERTAARVKDPAQKVKAVFSKALRYWNDHYDQFQVLMGMRSRWGVLQAEDDSNSFQPPQLKRAYRACQQPIRELFKTYSRPPLPVKLATDIMIAAIAGVLFIPRHAADYMPSSETVVMGKWVINALLSHWQQLAVHGISTEVVGAAGGAAASRRRLGSVSGLTATDSIVQLAAPRTRRNQTGRINKGIT